MIYGRAFVNHARTGLKSKHVIIRPLVNEVRWRFATPRCSYFARDAEQRGSITCTQFDRGGVGLCGGGRRALVSTHGICF